MWASYGPVRAWVDQKDWGKLNSHSAWLCEPDINLLLPSALPVLRPSDLDLSTPLALWLSGSWTRYTTGSWILSSQRADHETSQPPSLREPVPHTKSLSRYVSYLFCFSAGPWLIHSLCNQSVVRRQQPGIIWKLIRGANSQASPLQF